MTPFDRKKLDGLHEECCELLGLSPKAMVSRSIVLAVIEKVFGLGELAGTSSELVKVVHEKSSRSNTAKARADALEQELRATGLWNDGPVRTMAGVPFQTIAEPIDGREKYLFDIGRLVAYREMEKA